jgi:hypothetical protein
MHDSPTAVAALLLKWQESKQTVSVLFSGGQEEGRRTGKVGHVFLTTFKVSWDEGGPEFLSYGWELAKISEDARSLYLVSTSGERVVVFEEAPKNSICQ